MYSVQVIFCLVVCYLVALCKSDDDFKKCDRIELACKDSSCDLTSASYRGGYICDEFPFYAGGFPRFKVSIHSGECITYVNNSCSEWQTIDDDEDIKEPSSYDGSNFNNCKCMTMNNDNTYCQQWYCVASKTPDWNNIDNNDKYKNCNCLSSSSNNKYCSKWNCQNYKNNDAKESEDYYCTSDLAASSNYCWSWEGSSSNDDIFEVESCQCNSSTCDRWYCYKKTMNYWKSLFCLSVGLFGTLGLLIPLCFVGKLYCKKWCELHCGSCSSNGCCSSNTNPNQVVTIDNEGNEVYRNGNNESNNNINVISSNPSDKLITDDGSGSKSSGGDANCQVSCNTSNQCKYECYYKKYWGNNGNCSTSNKCGSGASKCGTATCGSGSGGCCNGGNEQCCMSRCCCCPKFYLLLSFSSLVTGGFGALIVNVCMWLFGFIVSCYLLKKYYCCYANGGNGGKCNWNKDNSRCKRKCNSNNNACAK